MESRSLKKNPRVLGKYLLNTVIVVFLCFSIQVKAQKNPNRVVKKNIRLLEKGMVQDSVRVFMKIVDVLSAPRLKKKFLKSAKLTLELSVNPVLSSSLKNAERIVFYARGESSYNQYIAHGKGIAMLEGSKTLADKINSSEISDIDPMILESIKLKIVSFKSKKEELKWIAVEELYQKAFTSIKNKANSKKIFRRAYMDLNKVKSLSYKYKKTDSLIEVAQELSTTRVQILSITGNTIDHSQSVVKKVENSINQHIKRVNKQASFLVVGRSMPNADVKIRLTLSARVNEKMGIPLSYDRVKTVKDDKGNERTIKATETHYWKTSVGYLIGTATLRDKSDKLIEERKIEGRKGWQHHWMTYAGNKDAVKNSEKKHIGSKERPYPKKLLMVQYASFNFLKNIEKLFRGLEQITD